MSIHYLIIIYICVSNYENKFNDNLLMIVHVFLYALRF
jgi:hypothetical protein